MKVKALKKHLADIPDNYDVELGKLFYIIGEKDEESFEIIMDYPIVGTAKNDESKHFRFMLWSKELNKPNIRNCLGKIKRIRK